MNAEQISVWVDGESEAREAGRALDAVLREPELRETCEVYWLIGDVLRSGASAQSDLPARVLHSLQDEVHILAPRQQAQAVVKPRGWMSAAAALAGLGVAAWMGLSVGGNPAQPPVMAKRAPVPAERVMTQAALPDEQAYSLAHQGMLTGTPMAGVAQYIRTVSDEQVGR